MDEKRFWKLVDAARETGGGGADMDAADEQAEHLVEALAALPERDIIAFEKILERKLDQAYDWRLWGAAFVINGGCSDDAFEYFRGWLVGRGRKVFDAALKDPETLADVADGDAQCEDLLYAARRAYERKAGGEMPDPGRSRPRPEPAGERWKEDDLEDLFPKLSAKFG